MYKLDLEKAEEPEIKLPDPLNHRKSNSLPFGMEFKIFKNSTSASQTTLKSLTVWITTNCGKFLKI